MSSYLLLSALEEGLLYALVVLGLYLSSRVLNTADLTVDGSFTLGAAVSAVVAQTGRPVLALLAGGLAGCLAGIVTAFLQTKCKIQPILSGIITMTALYSINLMVMGGKANVPVDNENSLFYTVEKAFGPHLGPILLAGTVVAVVSAAAVIFLHTPVGLAVRATGDNEAMVRSSSINTNVTKAVGLGLANLSVALSGAMVAQYHQFAEVKMGIGMMVIGLASLIIGELVLGRVFPSKTVAVYAGATVVGSVLYRLVIATALELNFSASGMKLVTATIVAAAMSYPAIREGMAFHKLKKEAQ